MKRIISIALIGTIFTVLGLSNLPVYASKVIDNLEDIEEKKLFEEKPLILPAISAGRNIRTFVWTETVFQGYASNADAEIILYEWDFDCDGIYDYSSKETGQTSNIYFIKGTYKAVFHAVDEDGLESFDSIIVEVLDAEGEPQYIERTKDLPAPSVTKEEVLDKVTRTTGDIYVVMINGGSEVRFWEDVEFTYNMFLNDYGIPDERIYLLNVGGLNPYGENPDNMIDYPASLQNIVDVFFELSVILTMEDTLFVWIDDHGGGYSGPNDTYYGFSYTKPEIDPGDEEDYLEQDLKLRSLYTGGWFRKNHGMDEWAVYKSWKKVGGEWMVSFFRRKFMSHYIDFQLDDGSLVSDEDILIEAFVSYLKGDINQDGIIDESSGDVMDFDGDGNPPFDHSTHEVDEDDWTGVIAIDDNYNFYSAGIKPGSGSIRLFDYGLDNRIDIDVDCLCTTDEILNGTCEPEIDGTDIDAAGLFDGVDVNDDGDMDDMVSMDEFTSIPGENLYDDQIKELLEPINAGLVIVFSETCYSGGLVEDLSAPYRIIFTATEEEMPSYSNYFVRGITAAFHGQDFDGNPVDADADADGTISIVEAFNYSSQADPSSEIPQYDDNADLLSHTDPIPNGGDGALGEEVNLSEVFRGWRCGDINRDGEGPDVADLTFLTNYLYKGGPEPIPLEAGNIDGIFGPAGPIDNNDLVYLIDYLYRGGPEPACE